MHMFYTHISQLLLLLLLLFVAGARADIAYPNAGFVFIFLADISLCFSFYFCCCFRVFQTYK